MYLLDLDQCDLARGWLSLRQVTDSSKVEYAILSHRWSDDEVLYSDIENESAAQRKGFSKIEGTIVKARRHGHKNLWVDSCCIDKKSSAELSEAINSMFQWYMQATACYVYLQDVQHRNDLAEVESQFSSSVWWTRAWTLQELIAPYEVIFYTADWRCLGTKLNRVAEISARTRIAPDYLLGEQPLSGASVATRMSWASKRVAERTEDVAYSLLGIFSVNMPLLYGEGQRAFHRLQEEILRFTDDQSLFAWRQHTSTSYWEPHGLLADSPEVFEDSGGILPYSDWAERKPSATTSKGIQLQLGIKVYEQPDALNSSKGIRQASLLCRPAGSSQGFIAISIILSENFPDRYVRIQRSALSRTTSYGAPKDIFALPDARAMRGVASTALSPYSDIRLRLSESHNGIRSFGALHVFAAHNTGASAEFIQLDNDLEGRRGAATMQQSGDVHVRIPKWRHGLEVIVAFQHGQYAPGLGSSLVPNAPNAAQLRRSSARTLLVMIGTSAMGQVGFDTRYEQLVCLGDPGPPDGATILTTPPFKCYNIGEVKTAWDEYSARSSIVSVKELERDLSGRPYDRRTFEIDIQENYARPPSSTTAGAKRHRVDID